MNLNLSSISQLFCVFLVALPKSTKPMAYYRLGVFGGFVVEEAVHNLAGCGIYNLGNDGDTIHFGGDDALWMIVIEIIRDDFGNEYDGNGDVCDVNFKK